MWVDSEGDEDHVFVVDFTDDVITMNEWGDVGSLLVHTSKFALFVVLKVVVCIGSDSVEDVFSVRVFGRVW